MIDLSVIDPKFLTACARAAHEVNHSYCLAIGEQAFSWDDAPEWQRQSATRGLAWALNGEAPEQGHAAWSADKIEHGWVFGPVKDEALKTHPCLVPYAELPAAQRHKDFLFRTTVRAMGFALGLIEAP